MKNCNLNRFSFAISWILVICFFPMRATAATHGSNVSSADVAGTLIPSSCIVEFDSELGEISFNPNCEISEIQPGLDMAAPGSLLPNRCLLEIDFDLGAISFDPACDIVEYN